MTTKRADARPPRRQAKLERVVDERQDGFNACFGPRLIQPAQPLHILLRHRLLPQPDGFEGLVAVEVGQSASNLAVFDLKHWEHADTQRDVAPAAARLRANP